MLHTLSQLLAAYGLAGIALLVAIESLGVPAPTELGYLLAQALVTEGRASYVEVAVALAGAQVLGACLSYAIGTRLGLRLGSQGRVARVRQRLTGWYRRYGVAATFLARFVGQLRPWSSYVAGMAGEGFPGFLAATVAGSLLYSVLALLLTGALARLWGRYPLLHMLIPALVLAFLVGTAVLAWRASGTVSQAEPS